MGARQAKRTAAPRDPGGGEARGRKRRREWRPELVAKPRRRRVNSLSDRALVRRVERIRRAVYDLYGDLEYFKSSPLEHRERLRQGLDWPDVGHITSLLRSLSEEGRFAEWLEFNTFSREKTA